jgi:FAD/FMN-containing dehydrogenase
MSPPFVAVADQAVNKTANGQPGSETREVVNFGGNVRFTPSRYYMPLTENDVLEILDWHAGENIRVVGSRHAWSDAIVSPDVIVDLRHIKQVEITETPGGEIRVTVGGGCPIKCLLDELHARSNSTLPTIGLITEQTIAGAISTATHGSGKHSLSHYVSEIRTAAYDPETGRARIYVWNGGDSLRAARCALGCLGVILSVEIRCVPKFLVAERIERCTELNEVLQAENSYPLQQFFLIPHLWQWMVQRRSVAAGRGRSWHAGFYRVYWLLGLDVGLHLIVKFLAAVLQSRRLVRWFYRRVALPIVLKNVTFVDESQRMLVMQHQLFKHLEIEIFVPEHHLRQAARFIQGVLTRFDSREAAISGETLADLRQIGMEETLEKLSGTFTHHYVVTFRRVLPDDTLISMTAGASEPWYAVSFITYVEPRDRFLAMASFLLESMMKLYGARPHWGKFCPLSTEAASRLYPRLDEFRAICRQVDPHGAFQNAFVSRVLGFETRHDAPAER